MEKKEKKKSIIVRPRGLTVLGVIMFLFAIIGIITSGFAARNFVGDIINQTTQKKEFEKIITSLVMQDPAPADELSLLNNSTIVLAGVFEVIFNENIEKYDSDGYSIIIPATDVEMHIKKLFGESVNFSHATITTSNIIINYSAPTEEGGNGEYTIPEGITYMGYTPKVTNIRYLGGEYRLTVYYINSASAWEALKEEKELTIAKAMVYVLAKENNTYKILRIEDTPIEDTPSSAASSEASSEKPVVSMDETIESAVA